MSEISRKTGPKGPMKPMSDEQFDLLSGLIFAYCTIDEIVIIMKMSKATLRLRLAERGLNFKTFFEERKAVSRVKVRKALLEKATGGDLSAIIFFGKQYMGWSEKQQINADVKTENVVIYKIPENGRDK